MPAFRLEDPGLPRQFSTPPEQLLEYHRDYLPLLGFTSCSAEAARNQLSESTNCPTNSPDKTQEPSVNSEPALREGVAKTNSTNSTNSTDSAGVSAHTSVRRPYTHSTVWLEWDSDSHRVFLFGVYV